MTPVKWWVLGLFVLGFGFPPAWLAALLLFEFGVRRGRTVSALWLESLIRGRWHGKE
jgi:hypothetical protein